MTARGAPSSTLSAGTIAAIVVAVLAVLAVLAFLGRKLHKDRQLAKRDTQDPAGVQMRYAL